RGRNFTNAVMVYAPSGVLGTAHRIRYRLLFATNAAEGMDRMATGRGSDAWLPFSKCRDPPPCVPPGTSRARVRCRCKGRQRQKEDPRWQLARWKNAKPRH